MNDREIKTLMADYLDDLLEGAEAHAAERAIAEHPKWFAEVARARALLYRPYAVPPPDAAQPQRILARYHDRPWRRVLHYAAVFVAGVVSALLADAAPRLASPPAPERRVEVEEPPPPAPQPLVVNRRLR